MPAAATAKVTHRKNNNSGVQGLTNPLQKSSGGVSYTQSSSSIRTTKQGGTSSSGGFTYQTPTVGEGCFSGSRVSAAGMGSQFSTSTGGGGSTVTTSQVTSPTVYTSSFHSSNQQQGSHYAANTISHQTHSAQYSSSGSRVVSGGETVIAVNTIVGEDRIISETIVEHEIRVPKKVIIEEVIEKVC